MKNTLNVPLRECEKCGGFRWYVRQDNTVSCIKCANEIQLTNKNTEKENE